jgi:putative phosphoribosyl transferase
MIFRNRMDAGRHLANALSSYKGQNVVVFALPRGGVLLGVEIARALDAQLDLIVVRKIGHPYSSEYAIAAIADDGHIVQNPLETRTVDKEWFKEACDAEQEEARRRRQLFLGQRAPISAAGSVAIIVDDGLATGLTMSLAIHEVRHRNPSRIVVAVPVAPPDTIAELKELADDIVVLYTPTEGFGAIGAFYSDFTQVSDTEVVNLMKQFLSRAA